MDKIVNKWASAHPVVGGCYGWLVGYGWFSLFGRLGHGFVFQNREVYGSEKKMKKSPHLVIVIL